MHDQQIASIENNSRGRKAVGNLIMQYRVERAARRMGKVAVLIVVLLFIAAVASIFTPKYL